MKYIDAEKLQAEIEKYLKDVKNAAKRYTPNMGFFDAKLSGIYDVMGIVASFQQEQPEVDLEKFTEKIKTFQARYKHPEIVSIKGAMAFMARMFYQYPNVAMEWYERLPKVTMD